MFLRVWGMIDNESSLVQVINNLALKKWQAITWINDDQGK